jgi:hypothetical protein
MDSNLSCNNSFSNFICSSGHTGSSAGHTGSSAGHTGQYLYKIAFLTGFTGILGGYTGST